MARTSRDFDLLELPIAAPHPSPLLPVRPAVASGPPLHEEVRRSVESRFRLVKHRRVRLKYVWCAWNHVESHPHVVNGRTTGETEGVTQQYLA